MRDLLNDMRKRGLGREQGQGTRVERERERRSVPRQPWTGIIVIREDLVVYIIWTETYTVRKFLAALRKLVVDVLANFLYTLVYTVR